MSKQKRTWDVILAVVMVLLCLLWIYPIVLILLNSLKTEGSFTTSTVFRLPTAETFAGLRNYVYGVTKMDFLSSMGYSLLITITSVVLILLCCSMTGWYLTRVNNKLSKFMNLLIVFSMVVPFQMVMFTLSKTADRLKLNTPWNICIIYLGFGAGLAVFMFTGFVKSMPIAIEEAAMIDGCNPLQIFFKVVCPILKPTMISTAILETMWVWNDYLLPSLVLDIKHIQLNSAGAAFAVIIQDVTWRREQEQALILKSVAIKEIHHRVKNNLQTIASLLRLQTRRTDSEETRQVLGESKIGRAHV